MLERAYFVTGPLPRNNEEHLALAEKETPRYCNTLYPAGGINARDKDRSETGGRRIPGLAAPGQCERAHATGKAAKASGGVQTRQRLALRASAIESGAFEGAEPQGCVPSGSLNCCLIIGNRRSKR